jgi:hypothetical protein
MKLKFESPNTQPEMLLAAFGGKVENAVWSAPETVEEPAPWQLIQAEPERLVFKHDSGVIHETISISALYEHFKDKIGTYYDLKAKFNLNESTKPATIDFKGAAIPPDND